jgi:hypothetical protein
MLVLTGQIKPIVRNGMHMVGVPGMLVIRVQCIMATSRDVRGKVVVLMTLLLVLGFETNQLVTLTVVVLGQITH